ncbi:hypothetical protein CEXT_119661 [Caerostris extrusa]|uniref:Uncharacterized protein n=1 Tax=Caerostris extrusa TaxID=172846 RepID=A0AAV4XMA7_CAEEX|nr:hypothetical protein CEXT_119661 [Caerostris extrusa]
MVGLTSLSADRNCDSFLFCDPSLRCLSSNPWCPDDMCQVSSSSWKCSSTSEDAEEIRCVPSMRSEEVGYG